MQKNVTEPDNFKSKQQSHYLERLASINDPENWTTDVA